MSNNEQPQTFKDWAHYYIDLGWSLVPIREGTKDVYQRKWKSNPITTHEEVDAHWGRYPNSNIGVICKPSDLLSVDADVDVENGKNGLKQWATLLEDSGISGTETLTQTTPSGGKQFIFKADGVQYQGQVGEVKPDIDIRAAGKYPGSAGNIFLAPPSVTEAGSYSWDNAMEPASIPPELAAILPKTLEHELEDEEPAYVADQSSYLSSVFERELNNAALLDPTQIKRNVTLNRMAFRLGRLYHLGGVNDVTILSALERLAHSWIGSKPGDDISELNKAIETINRAFQEGIDNPQATTDKPPKSKYDLSRIAAQGGARSEDDSAESEEGSKNLFDQTIGALEALGLVQPTLYMLQDVIQENKIHLFYAHSGHGKTITLTDMAVCLAAGIPWGKGKASKGMRIRERQKVLFIEQDQDASLTYAYVAAAIRGHGLEHQTDLDEWLRILCPRDIRFSLKDDARVAELINAIQKEGFDFIILDTWEQVSGIKDELNNPEIASAGAIVRRICDETGCSIAIGHHKPAYANRARGGTSLVNFVDVAWDLTKTGKSEFKIAQTKGRKADTDEIRYTLEYEPMPDVDDSNMRWSRIEVLSKGILASSPEAKLLDWVVLWVKANPGSSKGALTKAIMKSQNLGEPSAAELVDKAAAMGIIENAGSRNNHRYEVGPGKIVQDAVMDEGYEDGLEGNDE